MAMGIAATSQIIFILADIMGNVVTATEAVIDMGVMEFILVIIETTGKVIIDSSKKK